MDETYVKAFTHALALKIEGDIYQFAKCGYVRECRQILKESYGFVPFPFNYDWYWR